LEKRNWLKYLLKNYLILKTPWFELTWGIHGEILHLSFSGSARDT
jgi:hypothetical protein